MTHKAKISTWMETDIPSPDQLRRYLDSHGYLITEHIRSDGYRVWIAGRNMALGWSVAESDFSDWPRHFAYHIMLSLAEDMRGVPPHEIVSQILAWVSKTAVAPKANE